MHATDDLFLLQPIPSLVYQYNMPLFLPISTNKWKFERVASHWNSKEAVGRSSTAFQPISGCFMALAVRKMPRATGGLQRWSVARYDKGSSCWYFGLVQSISAESMWVMFFCIQIFLETFRDIRCWSRIWRVLIWRKHGGFWWLNYWWSWDSGQIAVTENTKEFWCVYGF